MSQILDAVPRNEDDRILCCYVNATSQIQIARITNIENWYFERVVFPGQRLVLEIHSGMMASAILSDTIPCTRLSINEQIKEVSEKKPLNELDKLAPEDPSNSSSRETVLN